MKITVSQLRRVIKEEVSRAVRRQRLSEATRSPHNLEADLIDLPVGGKLPHHGEGILLHGPRGEFKHAFITKVGEEPGEDSDYGDAAYKLDVFDARGKKVKTETFVTAYDLSISIGDFSY